jgi:hypothetical protein
MTTKVLILIKEVRESQAGVLTACKLDPQLVAEIKLGLNLDHTLKEAVYSVPALETHQIFATIKGYRNCGVCKLAEYDKPVISVEVYEELTVILESSSIWIFL